MLRAKKSYGQHFLKDESIAEEIIQYVESFDPSLPLVEVGPGRGVLTKYLWLRKRNFKSVEADLDMFEILNDQYPGIEDHLIYGNFLKIDLAKIYPKQEFVLFGNFPYNISSQILIRMVEHRQRIPYMVGMFQKEVAMRVVAQPGSKIYGRISVMIQAYYRGNVLFDVGPDSFIPPPKVNSAVIQLIRKEEQELSCDIKLFRQVVNQSFSQRRKMMRNTLKSIVNDNDFLKQDVFTKRPEQLSVEEFIDLTNSISKYKQNESRDEN